MSRALSFLADTRGMLDRLIPANGRPLLLYAVYTLVLFVIFLLGTFPVDLAIRRGLQQAVGHTATSEVTGARLGWNLTTTVDDLRLVPKGTSGPALLELQKIRVRPSILGLLRGRVFPISARTHLYGGTLEGTLDPDPRSFAFNVRGAGIDLGRYAGLAHFSGGHLRGRVNLTAALAGDRTAPTTLNGQFALTGLRIALEGLDIRGITVPDLHFEQLQIGGTVTDGRIDVTQLSGAGTELNLAGGGHFLLRNPLQASLLNMQITLTPTVDTPQGLRLALQLIPGETGPDDARVLQISGPLGAPRLR